MGWVVNDTPRPICPRETPVPIAKEAGWVPGSFGTGAENLDPTRIRSPDSPARSESLYRLRYHGSHTFRAVFVNRLLLVLRINADSGGLMQDVSR